MAILLEGSKKTNGRTDRWTRGKNDMNSFFSVQILIVQFVL